MQTAHIWDGANVVADVDNGIVVTTYLRGVNLISSNMRGARGYYLYNAHGDVVSFAGRFYKYDAFGNELTANANDDNPFRYAGEYFDSETETYYLRARYYDPATGRFVSEDTLRGNPTDPLSLNLYTYCYNSPTRYVDPSGHAVVDFAEFSRATIDPPKESLYQGAMTGPVDVHLILDGVGMIPIAGEFADGLNSILYMIEGDFGNAAISAISIVALVGDAAKGAKYGVKVVSEFGDEVVYAVKGLDEAVEGAGKALNNISQSKLQHEFKHAADYGITGNWSKANGELFNNAIQKQINGVSNPIVGTYRGTISVTHYYDPITGINTMVDSAGNFVGGWKLSPQQIFNLLTHGNVQ